jgi:GTP-binding protein
MIRSHVAARCLGSKGFQFAWHRGLASHGKKKSSGHGKARPRGKQAAKPAEKKQHVPPRLPRAAAALQPQTAVPPAYLASTASAHVFVAKCAAEEFEIDTTSIFNDTTIPPSFRKAEFRYTSPKLFNHDLPQYKIPEVAFLGRSNVGKSSLINSLMRKNLARASKRPGRTQTVHYFGLMPTGKNADTESPSSALGFLIDLPGYGFAKAPEKNVSEWQDMTQDFLIARRDFGTLQRLYLLVDARRGTSQFDRNIMGWFDEADIPYTLVLTKADKVSTPQTVRLTNDICMRYHSQLYSGKGSQGPIVHVTSAAKNRGIEELMASVDADFTGYFEESPLETAEESLLEEEDEANDL